MYYFINYVYVCTSFVYRYTQANSDQQENNKDTVDYAVSNVSLTKVNM